MKIEIDENSGFCFGVVTAINKAEAELAIQRELYCLGDIVHNSMVVCHSLCRPRRLTGEPRFFKLIDLP